MKKILWRVKQDVGPHTHGKGRYKSGETFEGPASLGDVFPDKLEPANAETAELVQEHKEGGPMAKLKVVHRGSGKYNVVNTETDTAINDELLSRAEAYALIAETEEKESEGSD